MPPSNPELHTVLACTNVPALSSPPRPWPIHVPPAPSGKGVPLTIGPNFSTVLQAARLGAEWAWVEIYRDLSPTVLRYLRAHGAADPEDVLGETFVHVVRRLADFKGDETGFRAWVFTIARSRLLDCWRQSERRPLDHVAPESLVECLAAENTEGEAMRRLAQDRVRATLDRLTPDQRDVIFLRIIAGLSIDEVARALGKKSGAVKSLQKRGLTAIRREISGEAVS
ncbi:MAG: sigma-70 family RNA polymerase sigma factor [Coriobacteriales bacterium]|nr:sigma-70 family RNA polymerase sigma factor [Coriobacteriales bacterium]